MKYIICVMLLFCKQLYSGTDSTTRNWSIKGYDFKFGGIFIYGNSSQFVNALKLGIQGDNINKFNFDNTYLDSSHDGIYSPVRIRLNTVFSNNKTYQSWLFNKMEIGVGLAFEIQNSGNIYNKYKNIQYSNYPNSNLEGSASYSYQCEGLEVNYQFSSKPFLKRLAIIGGLNTSIGLNTYKRYDDIIINSSDVTSELNQSFSVPYINIFANLGFKYNFTCELNFFSQAESGLIMYGRQIGGKSRFDGFCFGLRYKIIDEQDRAQFRQSSFW